MSAAHPNSGPHCARHDFDIPEPGMACPECVAEGPPPPVSRSPIERIAEYLYGQEIWDIGPGDEEGANRWLLTNLTDAFALVFGQHFAREASKPVRGTAEWIDVSAVADLPGSRMIASYSEDGQ